MRHQEAKLVRAVFYNLILDMTYHHICNILLVTQTSPGAMWEGTPQGCDTDREAEISQGISSEASDS